MEAPATTLFDRQKYRPPRAHARKSDPITSHEAAVAANARGLPSEHGMIVLQILQQENGLTVSEMAARCANLNREQIGRRPRELVNLGLIVEGEQRRNRVREKTRREITWWLLPDGMDRTKFDRDHAAAEALHTRRTRASHDA